MKRLLLIVFLLVSAGVYAQSERTTDFGGIVSAEGEVALGGPWGLSVEEELRFDHNFTQFDRWLNSVGVDYTCLHNRMNIGLTGDYIRRHNDRGYYENRGRLGLQVTYTEEYRRFKFQVRSKALATFFDERTGEHRVDFWVSNAETDTTEAHHWVGLVELFDSLLDLLLGDTELFGDVFDVGFVVSFW